MPTGDTMLYQGIDPDTTRGPSPNLWGQISAFQALNDPNIGYGVYEDFVVTPPTLAAGAEAAWGRYKVFASAAGSFGETDEIGGVRKLTSAATDNLSAAFAMADFPFWITAGARVGKLIFEVRIKTDTIADTVNSIFVGLGDASTLAVGVPLIDEVAAAGLEAAGDFVGFHRLEVDGDMFDTKYQAGGVTPVAVKTDAITIVADAWVKLGMVFDPKDDKLRFYKNGVELVDTKTVPNNTGTDFPADVRLGFIFGSRTAAATAMLNSIDWFRIFQYF